MEEKQYSYIRGVTDGGSQRTFISEDVSKTLILEMMGHYDFHVGTFGQESAKVQKCQIVELCLWNSLGGTELVTNAVEIAFICKDIARMPGQHAFVLEIERSGGTVAATPLYCGTPVVPSIALLIGADHI